MKDRMNKLLAKYDWIQIIGFLIISFSGFYLKIGLFSPIYWTTALSVVILLYGLRVGKVRWKIDSTAFWGILLLGYNLISQFIGENNSAYFNVLFSIVYFGVSYTIVSNISKNDIFRYCRFLFRISIGLLIVEAFWRFTHPILTQPSFYKFKFSSIMYLDSNFVATYIMCLIFLAVYLQNQFNLDLKKELIILVILCIATLSRATIIVVLGFGFLFLKQIRKKIKYIVIAATGIMVIPVLIYIFQDDVSFNTKFFILEATRHFFFKQASITQQIFGIGYGQSINYLGIGSHNFFITYLLESGVVGILLLALFWGAIFIASRGKAYYLMLPFLVTGLSMAPHFIPYLYCMYAIIIVLENCNKEMISKQGEYKK